MNSRWWRALEKHHVDRSKVKFVYLNPPDAAPALTSGKVDAWSMWSPGVNIARLEYKAHDLFLEGRDLNSQIDFSYFVVTREFSEKNWELVQAVNAAYRRRPHSLAEHPRGGADRAAPSRIQRRDPRPVHRPQA